MGGGRGHATRGLAVARSLAALGSEVTVLLPERLRCRERLFRSEHRGLEGYGARRLPVSVLEPEDSCFVDAWSAPDFGSRVRVSSCTEAPYHVLFVARPRDRAELRGQIERALRRLQPDLCLLDTFASGVLGELVGLYLAERVFLLARCLRPQTSVWASLSDPRLDRIFDLEPNLPWAKDLPSSRRRAFPPVVEEDASPAGLASSVLLVGSDSLLSPYLKRLERRLVRRGVDVRRVDSTASDSSPGSSSGLIFDRAPVGRSLVVVGAGGYNLTYECCKARVWHLAVPLRRPFDDQRLRSERVAEVPSTPVALEERIVELLGSRCSRPRAVDTATPGELARQIVEEASRA